MNNLGKRKTEYFKKRAVKKRQQKKKRGKMQYASNCKMRRSIVLLLISLVAVLSLVSCGIFSKAEDETEKRIYFLNFKPEVAQIYEEIAEKYKEETGVEVKIVTAAANTYEQTLKSEIAKSDAPTIFQVNGPIGYSAWKDYCADLSGTEIYKHLTDKNLAIKSGNGVYGIPYVVEGYGIIYNEEITDRYFALSGRATDFSSMDEVNSFDKLRALVEDMSARKSEIGIDGVFASTSLKPGDDWRWQTHLANLPIYYEFKDRNIDLTKDTASDIEFRYSQNYQNIFDLYLNNSVTEKNMLGTKQVADSMSEFALGRCAMVQNGTWAWNEIKDVKGNTVKEDKIKFLPIYIGAEGEENQGLCVGTENYFAINSEVSEEKQKLSADFLMWLFSSETGKKYVTEKLGFNAPFDTFTDSEKPSDPLAREVVRYLESGKENVDWVFTVFPSATFKENFGSLLLKYAQGQTEFEELKNSVIADWKKEASALK